MIEIHLPNGAAVSVAREISVNCRCVIQEKKLKMVFDPSEQQTKKKNEANECFHCILNSVGCFFSESFHQSGL